MNDYLYDIIKSLNIELYGTCSPSVSQDYINRVNNNMNKRYHCSFIKDDFLSTMNPKLYLENCKGIISIALPYHQNNLKLNKDQTTFTSSSWGRDYHYVVKEYLNKIIELLKVKYPNESFISLVDNHTLDERYYAYKSNIGFYGGHGLITNYKYGSNIFLGLILTSYKFNDQIITTNNCPDLKRYIQACPNNAITKDGINYNKCLSFITQKKDLTSLESKLIKDLAYGCDICSKVCSFNLIDYGLKEFDYDDKILFDINSLFEYSNSTFKQEFGKYAGSWRGKKIIARNIELIAINRKIKDES